MSDHEKQGTAYDSGATGYELQGRAASPFDEGDVVRLKIGGPLMTVSQVLPPSSVVTQWFVDTALHSDCFDHRSLESA